jgi:hypothetical protein
MEVSFGMVVNLLKMLQGTILPASSLVLKEHLPFITKIYCKLIPAPAYTLDMLIPFARLERSIKTVYTF